MNNNERGGDRSQELTQLFEQLGVKPISEQERQANADVRSQLIEMAELPTDTEDVKATKRQQVAELHEQYKLSERYRGSDTQSIHPTEDTLPNLIAADQSKLDELGRAPEDFAEAALLVRAAVDKGLSTISMNGVTFDIEKGDALRSSSAKVLALLPRPDADELANKRFGVYVVRRTMNINGKDVRVRINLPGYAPESFQVGMFGTPNEPLSTTKDELPDRAAGVKRGLMSMAKWKESWAEDAGSNMDRTPPVMLNEFFNFKQ